MLKQFGLINRLLVVFIFLHSNPCFAAVGCSLSDPDSDIRRFFPSYSHYVVNYLSFENQSPGGLELVGRALSDALDPVYETPDVPFTLYTVDGRQGRLGYVFGANQRGTYSNIQVIVIANSDLTLREIYIQRLRNPEWESLQGEAFLNELSAIPLEEFPSFSLCYSEGDCSGMPVGDPTNGQSAEDYRAILRAIAKLHLVSTYLLHPGEPPAPRDGHARAEWIGNYRGPSLYTDVLSEFEYRTASEANTSLDPRAPVFVWRVGETVRGYPLETLHRYPVIEDSFLGGDISVVMAGLHGNPVVLERPSGVHFRPTTDTLYGGRVVIEMSSGAIWSPVLAKPVYEGVDTHSLSVGMGGVALPWSLVRHEFPEIEVVMVPGVDDSWPDTGEMLVIRARGCSPSWRISDLAQGVTAISVGDTPAVIVRNSETVMVWQSSVGEQKLTLEQVNPLEMRDVETGSTWSVVRGEAVSGALEGARLLPMVQMRMSELEWRSHFEN